MKIEQETDKDTDVNDIKSTTDETKPPAADSVNPSRENVGIRTTVENAEKDGVIADRNYWVTVLSGEKRPNPEWIKLMMDRYHIKLMKKK